MRMAMRGISDRCRGDHVWKRRIDELAAKVARDAKQLARILREAAQIETVIRSTGARRSSGAPSVRSSETAGDRARRGHE